MVVATGITANGDREVLGLAVADSEDKTFWCDFLRSLRERGPGGVRLVISDHHLGLKGAIATVMIGAGWQRCRVHLMRNLLARVPRANAETVAAAVRTIFAQPDAAAVADQFGRITTMLEGQFPDAATALCETREDLLALSAFPLEHWRKLWSTNTLERLHREVRRSCDVVGCSPTMPPSIAW